MPQIVVAPENLPASQQQHAIATSKIVADPDAGTFTWVGDTKRRQSRGPVTLPLPGHGPGAIAEVVVATYAITMESHRAGAILTRFLFIGEDGRCLFSGAGYPSKQFPQFWPPEAVERLELAGIGVRNRTFGTTAEMEAAYPGSATKAQWFAPPRSYLLIAVLILLIFAAAVLSQL